MNELTYEKAGVDRDKADALVDKIQKLSHFTLNKKVKSTLGGYASLYELSKSKYLAACTDGVGTKLKLAFRLNMHNTVGLDLVAMSVNDLICVGAEPLFFLDYFATGKLNSGVAEEVIRGIVEGCKQAGCALVGGETAEMPDMYSPGEYDLAGFAVGTVDKTKILPKKDIKVGDVLIGVASSGFHSNGYSLLRKLLPEGEAGDIYAKELLTPTKIYVKSVYPLIKSGEVKAAAHITGSGLLNVLRISNKVSYEIHLLKKHEQTPIFHWVIKHGKLSAQEMCQTFNMGIGMVLVVNRRSVVKVLEKLSKANERAMVIGKVIKKKGSSEVVVHDDHTTFSIS